MRPPGRRYSRRHATPTLYSNASDADIVASYCQASRCHWDDQAQACDLPNVRAKGIGGLIICRTAAGL